MTNPAALDRAVREVTTPRGRIIVNAPGGNNDWWRMCVLTEIRARYRQMVAETRISGP